MNTSEIVIPDSLWDSREFTSIHTVVLHAELENSLMIASALSPHEYDDVVNSFQRSLHELIGQLREEGLPIGEYQVLGGQATILFYDDQEVVRNYQMDGPEPISKEAKSKLVSECRECNENLAIGALRAAIRLKNLWLIQPMNTARVLSHMDPWEIGIGMHYGRVILANRAGGSRRVEGYPVHLARKIQSLAKDGNYSHILISQQIRDLVLRMVIKHTQLRQRVFFYKHSQTIGQKDGLTRSHSLFELKFYHRIGIHSTKELIDLYRAIFNLNSANIWAYYQIHDYYAHTVNEWNTAYQYSKAANLAHPNDEKVLLDLAQYYHVQGKFAQSQQCAEEALSINDKFDLAHEHMAILGTKTDDFTSQIYHWRCAVNLSPDSAVNNLNLGFALLSDGQPDEGYFFVQEALRLFPEYTHWQIFREGLNRLKVGGLLPEILKVYLELTTEDDPEDPA